MSISVRDILSLKFGDVVRLPETRVGDPMLLTIGNKNKFFCRPGMMGNRISVQVTRQIEEIEKADFEELVSGGEEIS